MEKFKELEAAVASMKDDVTKFYEKGNNTAGVRIRKTLQSVKELAQEIRKEVSEQKKESKTV
jgi:phosphate uptake regulator